MTACSSTVTTRYSCPALPQYTKAFQAAAADELDALPSQSHLATLVTDYGRVRKSCRAIAALKKP